MATYDSLKQSLQKHYKFNDDWKLFFVCSFSTALVLTIVTSPIDLVKTRLMS